MKTAQSAFCYTGGGITTLYLVDLTNKGKEENNLFA